MASEIDIEVVHCVIRNAMAKAALDAAERVRWQPIETAPKGDMFIYFQKRDDRRAIGLAYLAVDGSWRDSEGNWTDRLNPTHWMPLPEPPK